MEDRVEIMDIVEKGTSKGLTRKAICKELKISPRTIKRWSQKPSLEPDGRTTAIRPVPKNKYTKEERQNMLEICHKPEYASQTPETIVPDLLDKGEYCGSASTFYRVLHENKEVVKRGRSRTPRKYSKYEIYADGPKQVWSWDITWLKGPVKGMFFYLYMFMDIWSRKIIISDVFTSESSKNAAMLIQKAVLREDMIDKPLILHSDNGSIMKAYTFLAKLISLGITQTLSRPRTSNDNAAIEALFRTLKYVPDYPRKGFTDLNAARKWVQKFETWYNTKHKHSGIKYLTPKQAHNGEWKIILPNRNKVLRKASQANPEKWAGKTKDWCGLGSAKVISKKPLTKVKTTKNNIKIIS